MIWTISNRYPDDIISSVLNNRGVRDKELFLNPRYEDLINERSIPGIKEAKERIIALSKQKKKVAIFADYDADGVCGGAIIYKALGDYFEDVFVIIPQREDGYGLNFSAVDQLAKNEIDLLITVDCGIKNVKEIEAAKAQGIETIVVDHHQLGDVLPEAIIVHPHLSKELKFKHFSGGGVAYFLAKALSKKPSQEKWLLDLVAISSIADMVPLIEDNRILVKFGLIVLNKTRNAGLKILLEKAQIKEVGAYEVGYMIAPRLNAAGRISMPRKSFELLTGSKREILEKEAGELNELNVKRQDLLAKAQREAVERVTRNNLHQNNIIILETKYPEGIIGLVAGKITQTFYQPSIVLTRRDGSLKGSARSVPGIDITALLSKSEKYLKSFGGHEQAAGVALDASQMQRFKGDVTKNASKFDEKLFIKKIYIDAVIRPSEVNIALAEKINKLEPFGQGNFRPVFAFENVSIKNIRYLGKNKDHLSFDVLRDRGSIQGIVFCFESKCSKLSADSKYDIAFSISLDLWNGNKRVKLIIDDVKEKN